MSFLFNTLFDNQEIKISLIGSRPFETDFQGRLIAYDESGYFIQHDPDRSPTFIPRAAVVGMWLDHDYT